MRVAGAVVEKRAVLRRGLHERPRHQPAPRLLRRRRHGEVEHVQGRARVARGDLHDGGDRLVVDSDVEPPEASLPVGERAAQDLLDLGGGEQLEAEDPGAREQRRHDVERRILGGRPDQRDGPVLHVRKHDVLLRAVETVDLVDEEDRADAGDAQPIPRLRDHRADLRDTGTHGGEAREVAARLARHQRGDRRLAGPRRPPEQEREDLVALDHQPERGPRAEHRLLPDELVEARGAHARGERSAAGRPGAGALLEEPRLHAGREAPPPSSSGRHSGSVGRREPAVTGPAVARPRPT